jgi:hypothetical protein
MARYHASSGLRTERELTDDNPEPLEIDELKEKTNKLMKFHSGAIV